MKNRKKFFGPELFLIVGMAMFCTGLVTLLIKFPDVEKCAPWALPITLLGLVSGLVGLFGLKKIDASV